MLLVPETGREGGEKRKKAPVMKASGFAAEVSHLAAASASHL